MVHKIRYKSTCSLCKMPITVLGCKKKMNQNKCNHSLGILKICPHCNRIVSPNYYGPGFYAIWFDGYPQNKYYGSTYSIKRRLMEHFCNVQTGSHINVLVQNKYNQVRNGKVNYYYVKSDLITARYFEKKLVVNNPDCLNLNLN
jgi:hypothetical protein